jgi:hypothetical protein
VKALLAGPCFPSLTIDPLPSLPSHGSLWVAIEDWLPQMEIFPVGGCLPREPASAQSPPHFRPLETHLSQNPLSSAPQRSN